MWVDLKNTTYANKVLVSAHCLDYEAISGVQISNNGKVWNYYYFFFFKFFLFFLSLKLITFLPALFRRCQWQFDALHFHSKMVSELGNVRNLFLLFFLFPKRFLSISFQIMSKSLMYYERRSFSTQSNFGLCIFSITNQSTKENDLIKKLLHRRIRKYRIISWFSF